MEISHQLLDNQEAKINIKMIAEDYEENYQKALKEVRKEINMPGFRPGKVPMGLIKKRYGTSIKTEEIIKILEEKIEDYLENDFEHRFFGRPIPAEIEEKIDFAKQTEFDFEYDLGILPEIDWETILEKGEFKKHKVNVTSADFDEMIEGYRKRVYKDRFPEKVAEGDLVTLSLFSLDEENKTEVDFNLINKLKLADVRDEKLRTELIDKEKEFEFSSTINNLVDINNKDIVALFEKSKKEKEIEVKEVADTEYNFVLTTIEREGIAEYGEDLYKMAFPNKNITTEEDFRTEYENVINQDLDFNTKQEATNKAVEFLFENADIELPEAFLRTYFNLNKEENKADFTEEEFQDLFKYVKREAVTDQILEDNDDAKIEMEDIEHEIGENLMNYYAQMGLPLDYFPEGFVDKQVKEQLEKRENIINASDSIKNKRITEYVKESVKFVEEEIAYKDYLKLLEEKNA